MNNQLIKVLNNNIEIKRSNSCTEKLYKKQSAKIHLVFLNFFNSIFYTHNITFILNLNLFYFIKYFNKNIKNIKQISFVNYYFINTNFNAFTNKKKNKKQQVNKYRRFFISSLKKYVLKFFKKNCKMITKFNYSKIFKTWFSRMILNKKNAYIINFNNIYIYCSEILNCISYFLWRISFTYLYKVNKLYKWFNKSLNYQKINIKNFLYKMLGSKNNKKLKKILKFFLFYRDQYNNKFFLQKTFFDNLSQEYIDFFYYIKNKYIKKIINIFDKYTKVNLKFKTYWNFSFKFKTKTKKKNKNMYIKKYFNFLYIFNNLINKYIYFIFMHWVNLFFSVCASTVQLDNISFFKKSICIPVFYNLYYEPKKYRGRIIKNKAPKLCYLPYFKPSKFLLYFKPKKTWKT